MSLKSFFLLLSFQIIFSILVFVFLPNYAYILIVLVVALAFLIEIFRMFVHRKRSDGPVKKLNDQHNADDGEYHNDFSKVPAGTENTYIPKPRNFLSVNPYKEFEDALNEDLKNIGLETDAKEKNKELNKDHK